MSARSGTTDWPGLLKRLRKERDLTQEQLARDLEVSFATVNGWENGRHQPIRSLGLRILAVAKRAGVVPPGASKEERAAPRPARRRKVGR